VDDVLQLVGLVAEVDVHVDQAGLEAGDRGLEVLGAVPEVEGDLVAGLHAAGAQRGGEIVRPSREGGPADGVIAVEERRALAGDGGAERVEDVTEIPAHGGRHSADTSAGASRGRGVAVSRASSGKDDLHALAARETHPLDREAERGELAGRWI